MAGTAKRIASPGRGRVSTTLDTANVIRIEYKVFQTLHINKFAPIFVHFD